VQDRQGLPLWFRAALERDGYNVKGLKDLYLTSCPDSGENVPISLESGQVSKATRVSSLGSAWLARFAALVSGCGVRVSQPMQLLKGRAGIITAWPLLIFEYPKPLYPKSYSTTFEECHCTEAGSSYGE